MALTNPEYDRLMRAYDEKRMRHEAALAERVREAYSAVPELSEIDRELGEAAVAETLARLDGKPVEHPVAEAAKHAEERRSALLKSHGFSEDYLSLRFDCPICRDTGYVGGKRCSCFIEAARAITAEGASQAADAVSLDDFSLDWYADMPSAQLPGCTQHALAEKALKEARALVEKGGGKSLLVFGGTGVGKTFLLRGIYGGLLEKGDGPVMFTAQELFAEFARASFERGFESGPFRRKIINCSVLIIDDLGTEFVNQFVGTSLFQIVSERITGGKSTVISTNLGLEELKTRYSERIFSRLTESYTFLALETEDIRFRKKLGSEPDAASGQAGTQL